MRRNGFTLLEVLLTLVLLVLVVGILHACLTAILASTAHGRAIGREAVEGRNLLAMIESDLRGALLLPEPQPDRDVQPNKTEAPEPDPHAFVAEADSSEDGQTVRIRFLTTAPLRGESADAPRTIHAVEYSLARTAGACLSLTRSAMPMDETGEPAAWELTQAIKSLRMKFWDGKKWTNTWDSEKAQCLPRTVVVDLALWLGEKPGKGVLQLTSGIAIPLASAEAPPEDEEGKAPK